MSKYNTNGNREKRLVDWSKFDHLLGTVKDDDIAALAGCTYVAVAHRRKKLGIPSLYKTHWTNEERSVANALHLSGMRRCGHCKQVKPLDEFHKNNGVRVSERGYNRWCNKCKSTYQSQQIERRRRYWIELAGGECQNCRWNTYTVCLDFHHVNGDDKSWTPARLIMSRLVGHDEVRQELEKCALLCSNCHQAIHRGALELTFVKRTGLGWTVKK